MSFKKTIFNLEWTDMRVNPQYADWLEAVPIDPFKARCRLCCKTFSLSNMGRQAITSHLTSSKHKRIIEATRSTPLVDMFQKKQSDNSQAHSSQLTPAPSSSKLTEYVTREETTSAEILWVLKLVSEIAICLHDELTPNTFRTALQYKCSYIDSVPQELAFAFELVKLSMRKAPLETLGAVVCNVFSHLPELEDLMETFM